VTKRDQSRDRAGDEMVRLTVAEAAPKLGISEAGVRKRVQRNQIPHERGDDGRLRVWVSPGEARHAESRDTPEESRDAPEESRDTPPQPESRALISEMRGRIASLEHQLEQERQANSEHRRLLAAALERIPPQLEAPQEASEAYEAAEEQQGRGQLQTDAPGAQGGVRRPWWRRMFRG
jgi:hypothetical protein